jgi:hypothetical protein
MSLATKRAFSYSAKEHAIFGDKAIWTENR